MLGDKGQPLLQKAGAQTDFSYVPGHKCQRYRCVGKWIIPSKLFLKCSGGPKKICFLFGLKSFHFLWKCTFKQTNKCSFFRLHFSTLLTFKSAANLSTCTWSVLKLSCFRRKWLETSKDGWHPLNAGGGAPLCQLGGCRDVQMWVDHCGVVVVMVRRR